jgi:hypothetical protein
MSSIFKKSSKTNLDLYLEIKITQIFFENLVFLEKIRQKIFTKNL